MITDERRAEFAAQRYKMMTAMERPGSLYRQNCAEQIRRAENCLNPWLLLMRDGIQNQYARENVLRLQKESIRSLLWC